MSLLSPLSRRKAVRSNSKSEGHEHLKAQEKRVSCSSVTMAVFIQKNTVSNSSGLCTHSAETTGSNATQHRERVSFQSPKTRSLMARTSSSCPWLSTVFIPLAVRK